MNRSYSREQRRRALEVFRRTGSVTKTVRMLGYPGRWTLYQWIRESRRPARPRQHPTTHTRYSWEVKLRAVELLNAGWRPVDIAAECGIVSPPQVYVWARRYRDEGQWGLMSKKERTRLTGPTRAAFEKGLPDDPAELKKQMAKLLVEKALLEKELDLVKKDESVIPGQLTNQQKTDVVGALKDRFPLTLLLSTIGLAASSFYYHHQREKPDKHVRVRALLHRIDAEAYHTYGYRRMWWALRNEGVRVSEKVVRRLMREEAIRPRYPRRRSRYSSYQGEISPAPANLVQRNFHAEAPNRLWLTDISMFPTNQGRLYLSAIIDCFDGKIVGARTSRHPTMSLAEQTLADAITSEQPDEDGSLVIHSDRGVHYRGRAWQAITRMHGLVRSMSKKGCSPDNAACEGFFGRMKNEMFYGKRWHTTEELEDAINEYVDFYNTRRIKLSLNGMSINDHRLLAVA